MIDFEQLRIQEKKLKEVREADPYPIIWVGHSKSRKVSEAKDIDEYNTKNGLTLSSALNHVYIGRQMGFYQPGSPLGNPYRLEDYGNEAFSLYRKWLFAQIRNAHPHGEVVRKELCTLLKYALDKEGVTLSCWCAPNPCHGDIIKAAMLWIWTNKYHLEWYPNLFEEKEGQG